MDFSWLLRLKACASCNIVGCAKTTVFPVLPPRSANFRFLRETFKMHQQRHKINPGASQTQFPTNNERKTHLGSHRARFWKGLGSSWAALGRHLAGFWALWGGSWALLAASWGALGHFLGVLGRLLAGLGCLLGAFWLSDPPRPSILSGFGVGWAGFWNASRACFAMPFAAPGTSLRDAFINAVATLLFLPAFVILPFWCGGLCAAHGIHPKTTSQKTCNFSLIFARIL